MRQSQTKRILDNNPLIINWIRRVIVFNDSLYNNVWHYCVTYMFGLLPVQNTFQHEISIGQLKCIEPT